MRLACSAMLTVLALGGSAFAQQGASPVVVSRAVARTVETGHTFVGTVWPLRKSVIGSAIDGRILEFPYKRGQNIEAGGALAELRRETIGQEVAVAHAERDFREAELNELKKSLPEEIAEAAAKEDETRSRRDYAQSRLGRLRSLSQRNRSLLTEDELQQAETSVEQAAQAHAQAVAAHRRLSETQEARLKQAEAQLLKQEAEVKRLESIEQKYTVISPFDGYVVAEHTEEGQWVSRGDLVAEVVDLSEVEIEIPVPQAYIGGVRSGAEATIVVDGVSGEPLQGTVVRIVPEADVQARTFPVIVRAKNPLLDDTPLLKSGMLARVSLQVGRRVEATLVPKDALVLGQGAKKVYVVRTEGGQSTAQPVDVTLGVTDGELVQVVGAVKPGDLVVVEGNERLRPGAAVKFAAP